MHRMGYDRLCLMFAVIAVPAFTGIAQGGIIVGAYEFFEYSGHYYTLTLEAQRWTESEAEAISLGGHLVSINDAAEQSFLEATFVEPDRSLTAPLWIGLNDVTSEGTFVWSNADPVTYTNWKSNEPNNFNGIEDWVAMNWEYGRGGPLGTWNDSPDQGTQVIADFGQGTNGPYRGIMEFESLPQSPVPEPSSLALFTLGSLTICGAGWRRRRTTDCNA